MFGTGLADVVELLRREPRARIFYSAVAQSSAGTGASYAALLVLTYARFESAWAISLVLLAEMVPAALLGPVLGAAADRWSRKGCAIAGDAVRAFAFLGIALVDSLPAMIALSVLAGVGSGLFGPAVLAGLPGLVSPQRRDAATSLFSAITTADIVVGPALGAALLVVISPEGLMSLNALTFAVSAVALAWVPLGHGGAGDQHSSWRARGLLSEARAGLRAMSASPGATAVVVSSALVLVFAGLFNVAQLPFAHDVLGTSDAGFFVLIAGFGVGIAAGSLQGAKAGPLSRPKRGFLTGLALVGVGFCASALASSYGVVLASFALAGVGNGLVRNNERLLIQRGVPNELQGRVFGIADAFGSALFVVGFVAAAPLLAHVDIRVVIALAGGGVLGVWLIAAWWLRVAWRPTEEPSPSEADARA